MTSDLSSEKEIDREVSGPFQRHLLASGREIVGSLFHFLSRGVDGVVFLTSFKCGIDALLQVIHQKEVEVRGGSSIPFLILSFDEHTGREGLIHPDGGLSGRWWNKKGKTKFQAPNSKQIPITKIRILNEIVWSLDIGIWNLFRFGIWKFRIWILIRIDFEGVIVYG